MLLSNEVFSVKFLCPPNLLDCVFVAQSRQNVPCTLQNVHVYDFYMQSFFVTLKHLYRCYWFIKTSFNLKIQNKKCHAQSLPLSDEK